MVFAAEFDSSAAAVSSDRRRRSSTGPCSPSGCCSSTDDDCDLTPTQLLGLAIKKRRNLLEEKERDYRRELLQSHFIQNLCKFLGEGRAKVRRQRRSSRRKFGRRSASGGGCGMSERDQLVPDGSGPQNSSPISGFESTLQNDDGDLGGARRCWRKTSLECSDEPSPQKRSRWDQCGWDNDELFEKRKEDESVCNTGQWAHIENALP